MAEAVPAADVVPQVLTEIQSGDGLSLSAAGRLFPGHRGNAAVDPSTVFRWLTRGMPAASGGVVKLEAVRVGGRWLTSRGAVGRFVAALTAAAGPTPNTPVPTTRPSAARRASEKAADVLKKMGA